jgi:hypothetical protein
VLLLCCSVKAQLLYSSANLAGHLISAECNPGGTTSFPCDPLLDVALVGHASYAEVVSNPRLERAYVNAIGHKKFVETFPDAIPIAMNAYEYSVQVRLPTIPAANPLQTENPQAVHTMIQLWDGRGALWGDSQHTLEATIYWELNPWNPDKGAIKIYSGTSLTPMTLPHPLSLNPDTAWHTFRLRADFAGAASQYLSLQIDDDPGNFRDLQGIPLAQRTHSDWGSEIALDITTESLAAFPGGVDDKYTWTTEFRNVSFTAVPEPLPHTVISAFALLVCSRFLRTRRRN